MKGHKKVNPGNRDSTKNGPSIQRHNFLWATHMTTHTACHLSYCQSVTQTNLYQPSRTNNNNNKKGWNNLSKQTHLPVTGRPPGPFPLFCEVKKNAIPNHHRELLWFPCLGAGIDTHTQTQPAWHCTLLLSDHVSTSSECHRNDRCCDFPLGKKNKVKR